MTAGGWMYIGPQGIVHGTFNTILGVGRKYLGVSSEGDLKGKVFVSSGLGGMSGAQPKAAFIAGAVGVFAEVDYSRIQTRLDQGWVNLASSDLDEVFSRAEQARAAGERISIAYHGNIVDLLEAAIARSFAIDLLSDQTSCHNAYNGGYCPAGLTFDERTELCIATARRLRSGWMRRCGGTLTRLLRCPNAARASLTTATPSSRRCLTRA